jgi:D-threo-aldose 1-dehydrogenase
MDGIEHLKNEPLSTRRMRRSGLKVTELGLGGAPLGNLYQSVDNAEAINTVIVAYESGVRYFDTAPLYGHGLSERRVGTGLAGLCRADFVLSTKVGRLLRPESIATVNGGLYVSPPPFSGHYDYGYDAAWRSLDYSLHRLGVSRIDIVFIHDLDRRNHAPDTLEVHYRSALEGAHRALVQMREQGVIAAFGLGVNEWEVCERFILDGDPDCFLLAGRYTLLEQDPLESFLPLCQQRDVSIIIGGPYNTGILATGSQPGAYYDYEPATDEVRHKVSLIERVCEAFDVPLAAAALRFPLGHPSISSVIPGARNAAEVLNNIELMATDIPDEFWSALKIEKLIREDAPVPCSSLQTVKVPEEL